MKQEPSRLAVPRAMSSLLGLNCMPSISPLPRLLAATDDSKKPSMPMRKEVPMASRMCGTCLN